MPYAPDLKYWVGIDYTIPDAMFGGDILMRFDYSYTADTFDSRTWMDYYDDDNDVDFDPPVPFSTRFIYVLVNLTLNLQSIIMSEWPCSGMSVK